MTYNKAKVFDFLNKLQIMGDVNMNFAAPNLIEEFGMDSLTARRWLGDWIQSFGKPYCEDCEG